MLAARADCGRHGAGALVAQLVEHLICNQGVGGSSPSGGTIYPLKLLYSLASGTFACTDLPLRCTGMWTGCEAVDAV